MGRGRYITFVLALALSCALMPGCSGNVADEPVSEPGVENGPLVSIAEITDARAALAEGNRLLDENQTERAIEFLEHAVSLDPDLAEGHFQLGIAYSLLELQYAQEGIVADTPSNDTATRTRRRSERSFERAIEAYRKWLDQNQEDDAAFFNLGRTYSKLLKDEEAEKAFRQGVKLKPEDSEYQTELGAILIKLAKYHEAIAPLKKAIELDAENVRAEELLEEAQAGRRRLDYVSTPKPDANKQAANTDANSSTESESSNSNSAARPRPANTNTKPALPPPPKPAPSPNRSN